MIEDFGGHSIHRCCIGGKYDFPASNRQDLLANHFHETRA
jgi:hypothetical protein